MIKRTLFNDILPWLGENKVIIIKGARQVGKTTLLNALRAELEQCHPHSTVYFAIDQELTSAWVHDPKLFLQFLRDQYGLGENKKLYVFLDEFQYLKQAGQFLKTVYDIAKDQLQLIVSGSSSLELTKNAEYLTGRKIEFTLRHFSFHEYLLAKSTFTYPQSFQLTQQQEIQDFYTLYRQDLEQQLLSFAYWGGYPEVVVQTQSDKKRAILSEIIRTYIEKDVAGFLHIEQVEAFNRLVTILATQVGNLVNKNELSNTVGLNKITLEKYLTILEDTFIFSFVRPYFTNIRKELSKMPKVYVQDTGTLAYALHHAVPTDFALLEGNVIENIVYTELLKQTNTNFIHFYRTAAKAEIDFVLSGDDRLLPIEVKFRQQVITVPSAIHHFSKNYGNNVSRAVVLTRHDLRFEPAAVFLPVVLLPFVNLKPLQNITS
ncbi:MAG: ATP-binding protein [Patescibacteria group bacterium]|jgi:hypothetical protein